MAHLRGDVGRSGLRVSLIPGSSAPINMLRVLKMGFGNQAIGRSRGGLSTKIPYGRQRSRPLRFILTAGQQGMGRRLIP